MTGSDGEANARSRWRLSTKGRVAVFGLLFLLLTACFSGAAVYRMPSTNLWVSVKPRGTGFACQMPRAPEVEVEEGVAFDGTPIRTTSATGAVSDAAYGAIIVETRGGFIPDLRERVKEATTGAEKDSMTQRSERSYEQDGFAVEELVLESAEKDAIFHIRHYLGRERIYSAFFAYAPADGRAMEPALKHFFASVQLDPQDASNPMGDGTIDFRAWSHIYARGAFFAVRLPGKARFESGRARLGENEHETTTYRVGSRETGQFLVRVVYVGDRPEAGSLDRVRKILEAGGYQMRHEEPLTVQGYAGRHGLFRAANGDEIEALYFVTNTRIYVVQANSKAPVSGEQRAHIKTFFDSFRIL